MDKVYLVSWARKLLGNRMRWNLKGALKLAITATYKQPDFRRTRVYVISQGHRDLEASLVTRSGL